MDYQLKAPRIPRYSAVEQVLTNRGIKLQDIPHYLNTTDDDIIEPSTIAHIKDGVKMLISHIAQNDKIFIQVDSDCDGYTSAAALMNYLYILFPSFVQNNITYRVHEGKQHGILPDTIPEDINLVIAPDSSSNDYSEHEYLKKNGIDVLVIDHHEAEKISEYACVINNQLCDYPTKSLSGVGMVYKFCSYIDELMNVSYANNILDLVALGMLADMMDLRDFETKHLVNKGLKQIKNPFFKTMIDKDQFHFQDEITPIGIAFYIAPLINATTRVGTQEEKLLLFESMLDFKSYELIPSTKRGCKGQEETKVEQACRNCTNIKNRQTKIRDSSLEKIEELISEKNLLENKILVIKLDDFDIDRNLTGLIANQLMSKYQRPVLILGKVIDKKNNQISWEGSGRGYDKSKLKDFKQFCQDSNLIMYAEGHKNAFGFGIFDEDFKNFIDYANDKLKDFDFSPMYTVDFIFHNNDLVGQDILDIAQLKPLWGQGVEEATIAVEGIKVSSNVLTLMSKDKNPTIKITMPHQILNVSLIKFKSSEEEYNNLYTDSGYVTINIVGKCERNIWNNNISPQIIIEDYEIVDRAAYYF